jgi:hypothetical protein
LWDWLQLLIAPFVLAVGGLAFQLANTRTESHIAQQRYEQDQKIALDKQRTSYKRTWTLSQNCCWEKSSMDHLLKRHAILHECERSLF